MAKQSPEPSAKASRFDATDERWSPTRWTGELGPLLLDQIRRLELDGGPTERPAHGHGFVLKGEFEATADGWSRRQLTALTDFEPFAEASVTPALARFSNLRARLDKPDLMGFAVKLVPEDGEESDLLAFSIELLPVATTRDFSTLLNLAAQKALALPRLGLMVVSRRVAPRALWGVIKGATTNNGNGFATEFHGMQTFRLVHTGADHVVQSTPFRYRWVPHATNPAGTYREFKKKVEAGLGEERIRFTLELITQQLGNRATAGDLARIDDPRYRWLDQTNVVEAGVLTLEPELLKEERGELGFNPGTLAPGLAIGDSDLFSTRQGAYTISLVDRK